MTELTDVETTAAALAKARERREAVKAKQAANTLALFDLGLKKQAASDAHAVALIADSAEAGRSRKQLEQARAAVEDAELLQKALVAAVSEVGGEYNLALRANASAVIAEQSQALKAAGTRFGQALSDLLTSRAAIIVAGQRMASAAESVQDSNPGRYKTEHLVTSAIVAASRGEITDLPTNLAAQIPETL
jgi:hypothetical protein